MLARTLTLLAALATPALSGGAPAGPAQSPEGRRPQRHELVLIVKLRGTGAPISLDLPLPEDGPGQRVVEERLHLRGAQRRDEVRNGVRVALVSLPELHGRRRVTYEAVVETGPWGRAPPRLRQAPTPPPALQRWLLPTPHIPSRSPLVREQLVRGLGETARPDADLVREIFDLVSTQLERRSRRRGTSNVLRALRESQADAVGLDRTFVTFLRAAGVPARIAGGVRLEGEGAQRYARWAEAYLDGEWLPFSVARGWYGQAPAGYLRLFHGDRRLIEREGSPQVSFKILVRPQPPEPQ